MYTQRTLYRRVFVYLASFQVNSIPHFTRDKYTFEVDAGKLNSIGYSPGNLTAVDADNPNTVCGRILFEVIENREICPIAVVPYTGKVVLSRRDSNLTLKPRCNVLVGAYNRGQPRDEFEVVNVILIMLPRNRTEYETAHNFSRLKREVDIPDPTNLSIRSLLDQDNPVLYPGCQRMFALSFLLPVKKSIVTLELTAPHTLSHYIGYIEDISYSSEEGRLLDNTAPYIDIIQGSKNGMREIKMVVDPIFTTFINTAFANYLRVYLVVKIPEQSVVQSDENVTMECAVHINGHLSTAVTESFIWDNSLPEAQIIGCPSTAGPGDIHRVTLSIFTPSPAGAYTSPNPEVQVELASTEVDLGRIINATVIVNFPPFTTGSYFLMVMLQPAMNAEVAHAGFSTNTRYTPRESSPIMVYTGPEEGNVLSQAKIYLGTWNTGNTSDENSLKITIGIKARDIVEANTTVGFSVGWPGGSTNQVHKQFTIRNLSVIWDPSLQHYQPKFEVDLARYSTGSIEADYGTICSWYAVFQGNSTYPAISASLEFTQKRTRVVDVRVNSVGSCLQSLVPQGISLAWKKNRVTMSLPILAPNCERESDLTLVINVALLLRKEFELSVTMSFQQGGQNMGGLFRDLSNHHVVMDTEPIFEWPQVLLFNGDMTDSGSLYDIDQVHVLLTLVKFPRLTGMDYTLPIHSPRPETKTKICKPRLLSSDPYLNFVPPPTAVQSNFAKVDFGKVSYKGRTSKFDGKLIPGIHTLTYAVPLIFKGHQNEYAEINVELSFVDKVVTKSSTFPLWKSEINTSATFEFSLKEVHTLEPSTNFSDRQLVVLVPGESVRYSYTVVFRKSTCTRLAVHVTLPNDNQWPIDISGPYVHSHGKSIWCLDGTLEPESHTSTSTKLSLGEVCSHGALDSWIRFEIFVRPWAFSTKQNPQNSLAACRADVFTKDADYVLSNSTRSISLFVNPVGIFREIHSVYTKSHQTNVSLKFAEEFLRSGVWSQVNISILVPAGAKLPNSSLQFECGVLANPREAHCTIGDIRINSGMNLAALEKEKFNIIYKPLSNSKQIYFALLDLGHVTQTAYTHYLGTHSPRDDLLIVTLTLKLSDISATFKNVSPIFKVHSQLGSFPSSSEKILKPIPNALRHLNMEFDFQPDHPQYFDGEPACLTISIRLGDDSNWECHSPQLTIYQGVYFESVRLVAQIGNAPEFSRVLNNSVNGISRFLAYGLYFDQKAILKLQLKRNRRSPIPSFGLVIDADLTCTTYLPEVLTPTYRRYASYAVFRSVKKTAFPDVTIQRDKKRREIDASEGSTLNELFASLFNLVTIICEVVPAVPVHNSPSEANCAYVLYFRFLKHTASGTHPLTQNGQFLHDYISAPYSPKSANLVEEIMYDSVVGWLPAFRTKEYFPLRYVDIVYGVISNIFGIKVRLQGSLNKVVSFDTYATMDGKAFHFYERVEVRYSTESQGKAVLRTPMRSRGIRIVVNTVEKEDEEVLLSADLVGESEEGDKRNFDPVDVMAWSGAPKHGFLPQPFVLKNRSLLYSEGQIFFCDVVFQVETPRIMKKCYRVSGRNRIHIQDLGPYVSQVLSYVPTEKLLFAIGADEQSILLSRDHGRLWHGINKRAYDFFSSKHADMINAVEIPLIKIPHAFEKSVTGIMCTLFGSDRFNACHDGIYMGNIKLIDWGGFCPFIANNPV
ncbi:unnamed protein product [Calicophoron daubneyi]|uniref:Uncharacterized protein n=1 Tax=Calicophoron daubneyi TaxID=300641 RepID=A0AAV2T3R4_CALDB